MNDLNSQLGTSWHSFPKVWNIGASELVNFFDDSVLIEEKVDGSQFSFGIFNGEIKVRSKGKELILDAPEKLFAIAVDTVKTLAPNLVDGWTYRGEYLAKPKHNALAYDRTPRNHIIIFDINSGHEQYLSYTEKAREAERLGLEVVPKLFEGKVETPEQLLKFMETISILGGQKIEGIVMKNYAKFGRDKKVLMAKHVSEAFKEVHRAEWKQGNPKQGDILQVLVGKYKTPARWNKAIQHLKEAGQDTSSPKVIGALIKEVQKDTLEECGTDIKEELFKWAWPQVQRMLVNGLPEWFKEQLVKNQFLDEMVQSNQDMGLYDEKL